MSQHNLSLLNFDQLIDMKYLEYAGSIWRAPGVEEVVLARTYEPLATVRELQ